jgi:DHA1 family bicyclomycin/chloramphenicol resistance-like MFS transporter
MRDSRTVPALSTIELVAMVAAFSALNAVAIDIMLPALPDIGADFGLARENDRQLVVVVYVVFVGAAQLVYGPLADAFGRRSVLLAALGIYVAGSVLCVAAGSFWLFLAARALQGIGAAATRVIAMAVLRDLASGSRMAQILSMAMALFLIVPIIAPGIGQLILFAAPWRWIFGALLLYSSAILIWTFLRLPETLAPDARIPFRARTIAATYLSILRDRTTMGYTLAAIFLTSCLFAYVTSSEQIFVGAFGLGAAFPIAFGSIAAAMSIGNIVNSRLVTRLGMRNIAHATLIWFTSIAALHALILALGVHSLPVFMTLLVLTMLPFGMIGGNFNALAMEPMGAVAGSASALFGALTALVGAVLGGFVAQSYDGTPLPFAVGLAVMGACGIAAVLWVERGRLFHDPVSSRS